MLRKDLLNAAVKGLLEMLDYNYSEPGLLS